MSNFFYMNTIWELLIKKKTWKYFCKMSYEKKKQNKKKNNKKPDGDIRYVSLENLVGVVRCGHLA